MSLLIKGAAGVTTLSALTIDADKDWMLKAITRLAGLDAGQVRGDIWAFDFEDHADLIVKRLQAMEAGKVLCSRGLGKPPFWAWVWEEPGATGSLLKYYPALIDLTHDEDIVSVAQFHNENAPIISSHVQAYVDDPADYIMRRIPAVALTNGEAIVAFAQNYNKDAPIASAYTTAVA